MIQQQFFRQKKIKEFYSCFLPPNSVFTSSIEKSTKHPIIPDVHIDYLICPFLRATRAWSNAKMMNHEGNMCQSGLLANCKSGLSEGEKGLIGSFPISVVQILHQWPISNYWGDFSECGVGKRGAQLALVNWYASAPSHPCVVRAMAAFAQHPNVLVVLL